MDFRAYYPIFEHHQGLVYLDNAATSQRLSSVIEAERDFSLKMNANPLRGIYKLASAATEGYETTRKKVKNFIGANSTNEIVFTRNTTESINLVATSYGATLKENDEIIVTIAEHHSNLVPWQNTCKKTGAKLIFLECEEDGSFDIKKFKSLLSEKTKIVALTHASNVLGYIYDVAPFIKLAHEHKAVVLLDCAQSIPHVPINVQELNADFVAFSAHKMSGPFGVGVLYGKERLLDIMEPYQFGGEMIDYVERFDSTFAELPHKFEAGTVNAASVFAFSNAIDFYNDHSYKTLHKIEETLSAYMFDKLSKVDGIKIIGSKHAKEHNGIFTFTLENAHPHDIAQILDDDNIAIRAGHHCTHPLHSFLNLKATTRASIMFYNTTEDIDKFIDSLSLVRQKLGV